MEKPKSKKTSPINPQLLFEHSRVKVYSTVALCWIEIDGVAITQGIASAQDHKYHGSDTHLKNMGKSFAKCIDNGRGLKIGKNGRIYSQPPKQPGKRAGRGLTDMDVLAALGEAIQSYREMCEWDAEFELTKWHLERKGLAYNPHNWSGTAPMAYVVNAIMPMGHGTMRRRDLNYAVSGKMRRLRKIGLIDYIDATGQLACAKRPDDAFASKMWLITDFGYESLEVRKRHQRELFAHAEAL